MDLFHVVNVIWHNTSVIQSSESNDVKNAVPFPLQPHLYMYSNLVIYILPMFVCTVQGGYFGLRHPAQSREGSGLFLLFLSYF